MSVLPPRPPSSRHSQHQQDHAHRPPTTYQSVASSEFHSRVEAIELQLKAESRRRKQVQEQILQIALGSLKPRGGSGGGGAVDAAKYDGLLLPNSLPLREGALSSLSNNNTSRGGGGGALKGWLQDINHGQQDGDAARSERSTVPSSVRGGFPLGYSKNQSATTTGRPPLAAAAPQIWRSSSTSTAQLVTNKKKNKTKEAEEDLGVTHSKPQRNSSQLAGSSRAKKQLQPLHAHHHLQTKTKLIQAATQGPLSAPPDAKPQLPSAAKGHARESTLIGSKRNQRKKVQSCEVYVNGLRHEAREQKLLRFEMAGTL